MCSQLFLPQLRCATVEGQEGDDEAESTEQKSVLKMHQQLLERDEPLQRRHKFEGVINTTLQQLQIQGLTYINAAQFCINTQMTLSMERYCSVYRGTTTACPVHIFYNLN